MIRRVLQWGGIGLGLVALGALAVHGILSVSATLPTPEPVAIRLATYNVHYIAAHKDTGTWSLADWERRKEPLAAAVGALDADVIGFQEMETWRWPDGGDENLTLDWLLAQHPEYTAGAVGDPTEFPSTQPIFYRSDRFLLLDQGWFFFSDTPERIYSRSFNGAFPAFASWVELQEQTTEHVFKVVNIHTDYKSYQNRLQSLKLVTDRITPWLESGEAVVVLGDYNAWRGSRLHQIIEAEGPSFAPVRGSTYHFNQGLHLLPAVDHVAFSNDFLLVRDPVVVQRRFLGKWPTDHYPVVADLQLP